MIPTVPSLPLSMFANVLRSIRIALPPAQSGTRWCALWKLFEETLPHLVRLIEITFYFRHKEQLMSAIMPLVPHFARTVTTIRMVPVAAEAYCDYAPSNSRCANPLDWANDQLPWLSSRWPQQLAALGPVQHFVLVTNIPVVWPPVPEEEVVVMRRWTSQLISAKSKLQSIKIKYFDDDHNRYPWASRIKLMDRKRPLRDAGGVGDDIRGRAALDDDESRMEL
ncbi:hypothetical protein HWV62_45101 [Athelia sp. TMB]|nr:hypothetical protein HWV62_45101 [Athelia sp. TMB]